MTPTGETWVINAGGVTSVPNFDVDFESNGTRWASMAQGSGSEYYNKLCYESDVAGIVGVATILSFPTGASLNWTDEAYRTIVLDEPASGDFLTWLEANAVKQ